MAYLSEQPNIPRADEDDYSDDPVVGFPALTTKISETLEFLAEEVLDARGVYGSLPARLNSVVGQTGAKGETGAAGPQGVTALTLFAVWFFPHILFGGQ